MVPRFETFDLYDDEQENCDFWNWWVGQLEERGSKKSDGILTKGEREDLLDGRERDRKLGIHNRNKIRGTGVAGAANLSLVPEPEHK